jgi:hypothetical protein
VFRGDVVDRSCCGFRTTVSPRRDGRPHVCGKYIQITKMSRKKSRWTKLQMHLCLLYKRVSYFSVGGWPVRQNRMLRKDAAQALETRASKHGMRDLRVAMVSRRVVKADCWSVLAVMTKIDLSEGRQDDP